MKHWGLMFRQTILHPKFGEYSGPLFEGDKRQWHTLKRRATVLSKHWCNFFCWYGSPVNAASEATSWWVCFPFIAWHLPCHAQVIFHYWSRISVILVHRASALTFVLLCAVLSSYSFVFSVFFVKHSPFYIVLSACFFVCFICVPAFVLLSDLGLSHSNT